MFVLDTNVVSELRRPERASPAVTTWARATDASLIYLSVVTLLELELGVLRVERRDSAQGAILRAWLDGQILPRFHDRLLVVDAPTVLRCASLHVPDPRSERDGLIAASALVHGMTLVTRNLVDFANMGVALLDPWALPAAP